MLNKLLWSLLTNLGYRGGRISNEFDVGTQGFVTRKWEESCPITL
jgi:hypothetical protein